MISFRKIALLLALPGALAMPGSAEAATRFTTATSIAVYDVNIHKMDDNWQGWVADIRNNDTNAPVPDVILGQDFQNETEIQDFQAYIGRVDVGFGTPYAYAASNYTAEFPNRRVIFWRTARFTWSKADYWMGHGGTQANQCAYPASNTQAIQVQLWDALAAKYVAAVSMKTPPNGTFNECVWRNMQLATSLMNRAEWTGSLQLIGMDTNAPEWDGSSYNCWWRGSVAADGTTCNGTDLGYSDVIYDLCSGQTYPRNCLDGHWTHKNTSGVTTRIDYLFAKRSGGAGAVSTARRTIDKGMCSRFSDHCSVRAEIGYGLSI